jgi:hypothetical protein
LRKHIVNTLTKLYPSESWEKIIDSSVYGNPEKNTKGSGLRMPWSHKKGKHAECGGNGCTVCDNSGKLTEVAYLPIFMYRCEGPFKIMERLDQEPSVEALMSATIRTDCKQSNIIDPPENIPKKKEGYFSRDQTKNDVTNTEISAVLETFIRKNMNGQSQARINKIFKDEKGGAFFVGTDSSFCENAGKNHSSNHVWFLVKDMKISQKCFCRCEILRKKGFCKDFTGREHELSPSIVNLLYPNKKTDRIKKAIQPRCLSS